MKLLVTGGAGFIGSNFIRYWLKNHPDDYIVNLDLLTYAGNADNLKDIEEKNYNYELVEGDICDAGLVHDLVQGVSLIVHFAAESHVDRSISDSSPFVRTNVLGTQVLLDAAKNNGNIRFHHVSTDEVFGSLELDGDKFRETTPYDPRSPYSASKAASDHLVRAYWHTHKLPVTISNCTNNYGPYQFPEKLIPLFVTNLMEGKKVPVYGRGSNIRDWIYVDDHNAGVEAIIERGKIGETYCLGGENELSNLEITNDILKMMGVGDEMVEYVEDRKGHDFRYAMDISKAKQELEWYPKIDFKTGLEKTVAWYKENPEWWQKLKSRHHG
ncbi:dTDP-glucose 4,6-dehydratase [Candidatus Falkowbacteria bacterium]|nr:dTDP-glucose 4,6-dehydratase [Candidatus Falkowbacteria bacterium]